MKKVVLSVFLILFAYLFLRQPQISLSQERYAACDLCGLCQKNGVLMPTPQSWESCRLCLYPNQGADPLYTLRIDPSTNSGPTPLPGNQYTMLGCIQTNTGGFTSSGAVASVAQPILNIIFSFASGIAFLYLLYGGYLILTSQADPERLDHGKRVVTGAIVGIIFTLSSVLIINLLANGVLRIPGFGS